MAKNDKPTSKDFDEAKAAKKKLKEAEKAKGAKAAPGKDKADAAPKKKKARRFVKDFRGEIKKIVWPDFKTVMKNTGIVLVTVLIIGAGVWILDWVLSGAVTGMKNLAQGVQAGQQTTVDYGSLDEFLEFETTAQAPTEAEGGTEAEAEPTTEPETETEPEPATEPAE